ncbi:Flagellar L-ring protein [Buchnera aphidicola (Thelaxes suberi)]|uniref:flagellar basal body L-ring protein FlgH n=1 Tax=Buchnera aphidicola TaxID=9 RepID=UPI003464B10A
MILHFFLKCRELTVITILMLSLSGCLVSNQEDIDPNKHFDNSSIIAPMIPDLLKLQNLMSTHTKTNNFSLFENKEKYQVGDVITVILKENITTMNHSSDKINTNKSIYFNSSIIPNIINKIIGLYQNKSVLDESSKFFSSNKGVINNKENFEGAISVIVTKIMNNGNLKVVGEKQIGVNQNVELIRFTGIINPKNVHLNNSIESNRVANVYIRYTNVKDMHHDDSLWDKNWIMSLLPF